jgi:hypothetical protein
MEPAPEYGAPGPAAYRGWSPPTKEWDKADIKKGDKTRVTVEDEWDEDGNLTRTTVTKKITPDWKWKTTRAIEEIPAALAAEMGLSEKILE